jgi:hypothetical protein
MKTRNVSVLLLGALAVVLTSQPANAALAIRFTTDSNGAVAGGTILTTNCASIANSLVCTAVDAYFDAQLATALTNVPGTTVADLGKTLNVTSSALAISSGATLMLEVYAYDFTGPTGSGTLTESLTANNPVASGTFGSITGQGFIALPGGGANLFSTTGQTTPIANVTCLTLGGAGCGTGGAFIGTDVESASASTTSPFAFTNILVFDPNSTGIANFTSDLSFISTPVPEPASVVLMGTTLLGLSALLRKKFRRA